MGLPLVQYLQAAVVLLAVKLVAPQGTSTQGERLNIVGSPLYHLAICTFAHFLEFHFLSVCSVYRTIILI